MKKNSIPKLELVFLLLLTGMCPQAHATDDGRNASPQKTYAVDLTLGSATVLTFTEAVTSQTGVLFSYESALSQMPLGDVSVHETAAPLEHILEKVFKGRGFRYKVVDRIVVLTYDTDSARSQLVLVTGRVKDGSGMPLVGASVVVKDTMRGVSAGAEGNYRIFADPEATLVFSYIGYADREERIGTRSAIDVVLEEYEAVLGAKGAITGTVTEVSAADPVDISAAKARFREFEATLTNVTPDCRIVISTSEKRALLDNVVVTCTAITPATKPAAPGGVSFDAAAAADRLTLKWNAVPDATSYTVAYWKGSASAPESEYAYKTGIASTATSQELTNLESNTSYWAKVKAVGSLDSDWSETANATTMDSGGEPLLPTADLLDVVFRNDGSAMDNSSSATPVRRMPSSRP